MGRHIHQQSSGMSLLEMVVAMMMLVMFTSVVVAVLEVTARFAGDLESRGEGANGVLIDHQVIQAGFDQLIAVLSQPGISKNRMLQGSGGPQIAYPIGTSAQTACVLDPITSWDLPGEPLPFPPGYRICVWSTSLAEPDPHTLIAPGSAKPGIYVLQALPDSSSAASLPTRRLFCRPKPYC